MTRKRTKKAPDGSQAIAAQVIERWGDRPGDEEPERQTEYDAMKRAADGDDPYPDDGGLDPTEINNQFAIVPIGSRVVVLWEKPDASPEDRIQLLQVGSFQVMYGNRFVEVVGADRKPKFKTIANAWLDHKNRRQYDGIEFYPDPLNEGGTPRYYNLWRGWSVEPRSGGSYAIFKDHLLSNVCNGDRRVFEWVFGWFAQMMQRPREKPGTAIVLRGAMGAGKTKVGEVIGSLIASHHFLIDNPRYLVGQFNSHMAACLMLQADEAVFAGDKATEGHLRGLITSDLQMIESKGVDPIRMRNFMRVIFTSNEDWVIPAGKDERRFAVLDVASHAKQNHDYFAEMDAELDDGGREALLFDLLSFDLSKINLREIPKTEALLEQKLRSFTLEEQWLFDRLRDGALPRSANGWPNDVESDVLYRDFIHMAEQLGNRYRPAPNALGMALHRLLPGIRRVRRSLVDEATSTQARKWVYQFPTLAECRRVFSDQVEQPISWGDDNDD